MHANSQSWSVLPIMISIILNKYDILQSLLSYDIGDCDSSDALILFVLDVLQLFQILLNLILVILLVMCAIVNKYLTKEKQLRL